MQLTALVMQWPAISLVFIPVFTVAIVIWYPFLLILIAVNVVTTVLVIFYMDNHFMSIDHVSAEAPAVDSSDDSSVETMGLLVLDMDQMAMVVKNAAMTMTYKSLTPDGYGPALSNTKEWALLTGPEQHFALNRLKRVMSRHMKLVDYINKLANDGQSTKHARRALRTELAKHFANE